MWCLARLLPLMIGEFVPEDDERWKLFLTLLTIIDYVFAPRTNQQVVSYLAVLIKDHHEEFKRLYPNSPITPKLHNMIHIPEWIERYYIVHVDDETSSVCSITYPVRVLIHALVGVALWYDIGVCDMKRNITISRI